MIIDFCKEKFFLNNNGIIYWKKYKTAIISDLHLEKGSYFGKYGQFLPPYDSEDTLKNLIRNIREKNINKLVFLGDTFHDNNGIKRLSDLSKKKLNYLTSEYECVFVKGNHDNDLFLPNALICDAHQIDNINFYHKPRNSKKNQIAGHFHPKISIRFERKKLTSKCLIHSDNVLILPSFGSYTGGLNIRNKVFKNFIKKNTIYYFFSDSKIYRLNNNFLNLNQ